MDERLFLPYDNSCGVKLEVSVSRAVKDGKFAFCCGQADMGSDGYPQRKYDLKSQTSISIKLMEDVFQKINSSLEELVRVQIHYINDGQLSENEYQTYFESLLPENANPILIFTPLPNLFYDGLSVEIDGISCKEPNPKKTEIKKNVLCELINAGGFIFSIFKSTSQGISLKNQVEEQFNYLMEKMDDLSIDQENILKIYTYYATEDKLDAIRKIATYRNTVFGSNIPPCSDVPVEQFNSDLQGEEFRLEVVMAKPGTRIRQLKHSDLSSACQLPYSNRMDLAREANNFIFFATHHPYHNDGELLYPGQIEKQTRYCMETMKEGLAYFGSDFTDMMKMTTFYKGNEKDFHNNLSIRNSYLRNPGAASTGVPLKHFTFPEQLIQVEGIACMKRTGLKLTDLSCKK